MLARYMLLCCRHVSVRPSVRSSFHHKPLVPIFSKLPHPSSYFGIFRPSTDTPVEPMFPKYFFPESAKWSFCLKCSYSLYTAIFSINRSLQRAVNALTEFLPRDAMLAPYAVVVCRFAHARQGAAPHFTQIFFLFWPISRFRVHSLRGCHPQLTIARYSTGDPGKCQYP